jgi:hypothetical protein
MNTESCSDSIYSLEEDEAVDPAFFKFCIAHGLKFGDIRAVFVPSGWRGVIATQDIAANTCALRVPRNILLSCETASLDAELAAVMKTCPPLSSLSLLAVHLLHELSKGSASLWAEYLRSLPPTYTTAISLSATEAAALQVSYAQHQVAIAKRAADLCFIDAFPVLQKMHLPSKWTSKSAFLWALATIMSRSMWIDLQTGEESSAGCLTPFGDLFNYAPPEAPYTPHLELDMSHPHSQSKHEVVAEDDKNSTSVTSGDGCLDIETNEYCIYVRKDYKKNEEIFLCYGRYTNLQLLEHYGFVLIESNQNPHDMAVLPRDVLPEAVVVQLQSMDEAESSIHANGNPSWEFLRALRFAALTPAQRKIKASAVLNDEKVDDASEIWVMKTLKKACEETLQRLPTSLQQDEELLRAGTFETEGLQVAIQWRCSYKRILTKTIEICNQVLKSLGVEESVMKAVNGHLANLNLRQPKLLASTRRNAAGAVPPAVK